MASNSPPSEAVRARSPRLRTSSPAWLKRSRASSDSRPLLGSAIRSIGLGFGSEGRKQKSPSRRDGLQSFGVETDYPFIYAYAIYSRPFGCGDGAHGSDERPGGSWS